MLGQLLTHKFCRKGRNFTALLIVPVSPDQGRDLQEGGQRERKKCGGGEGSRRKKGMS